MKINKYKSTVLYLRKKYKFNSHIYTPFLKKMKTTAKKQIFSLKHLK